MDVVVILKAAGAVGLLGIASGGVLSTVAKRTPAAPDERVARVLAQLPSAGCGACGASCMATAVAIAHGRKPVDACVMGGRGVAEAIADALSDLPPARRRHPSPLHGIRRAIGRSGV